jgi:hypothetical protein
LLKKRAIIKNGGGGEKNVWQMFTRNPAWRCRLCIMAPTNLSGVIIIPLAGRCEHLHFPVKTTNNPWDIIVTDKHGDG